MSRWVLEISGGAQRSTGILRVTSGDTLYLKASPALAPLASLPHCTGPTGEVVEVVEEEGAVWRVKKMDRAGPYTLSWNNPLDDRLQSETVLVDPVLHSGDKKLSVDSVVLQSHLVKCCGSLERWNGIFQPSAETGYNLIHLTPVQQLGVSRSSYSLHSHLALADSLGLDPSLDYDSQLEELSSTLDSLRQDLNLLFLSDVVWNHVSICNKEILDHPEAYYNLHNTPNLIPAYLIDRAIVEFGATLKKLEEISDLQGFEVRLRNHLGTVRTQLEQLYSLPPLPSDSHISDRSVDLQSEMAASYTINWSRAVHAGTVDWDRLRKTLIDRGITDMSAQDALLSSEVARFNSGWVVRYVEEIVGSVVGAVRGAVDHRFVQTEGLKLPFPGSQLVDRYFHVSDCSPAEEAKLDVWREVDAQRVKTCNGWTMGESTDDMATTMAYTKRQVVSWGDSVKLRYGREPADSPWLWDYMKRYTCDMARLFEGFRIDNCHNTALHVGEWMLRRAREVRPELYVVAELFTGSEERDCLVINTMGLNSCIRELSQSRSPRHLGEMIHHYGESTPCGNIDSTTTVPGVGEVRCLRRCRPRAMLMDQTHDNPCPFDQHPISNILALSGAMCGAMCGVGSTRGYDDLVPHHVHVVNESRLYPVDSRSFEAKRCFIALHQQLESEGYTETFVDQIRESVMILTRHNPETCEKVLVVTAAHWTQGDEAIQLVQTSLPGSKGDVLFGVWMDDTNKSYMQHSKLINGYAGVKTILNGSALATVTEESPDKLTLSFRLPAGSCVVLTVRPPVAAAAAIDYYRGYVEGGAFSKDLGRRCSALDLSDVNHVLYRCAGEEAVAGCGGVYSIPGHGDLPYAGIAGFLSVLEGVDTSHPFYRNITAGFWPATYTTHRLSHLPLGQHLSLVFERLREVPDYMRCKVFSSVLRRLYTALTAHVRALTRMEGAGEFEMELVMTSLQMVGRVGRCGVPVTPQEEEGGCSVVSMAAGLPHFSHGFMRCWGRDTFIALPGLLLATHRLKEAKDLVLGFARTLRYGLIPNLLSEGGERPRYNCRDAVWWWCRCVVLIAERDPSFADHPVYRFFAPGTDIKAPNVCTVVECVREAIERHRAGITFTEEGAGPALDEHLKYAGFTVTAGIDPETGFVFGGSEHNCGTWMDKVGSSDKAGNRGIPATPRDGAAVELVGLCHMTLTWLHRTTGDYGDLLAKQRESFERCFWAGTHYKDTFGGHDPRLDAQLRPNQCVAMVVAPELFSGEKLAMALHTVGTQLAGPLGMRTLGPEDPDYRPFYDNGNNGTDRATAHGFNYHQGPEWVWCMGYYLRAKLAFERRSGVSVDTRFYHKVLATHREYIRENPFRGLPELTNRDGAFCAGSCPTQAWSSGCLLEFLEDLRK